MELQLVAVLGLVTAADVSVPYLSRLLPRTRRSQRVHLFQSSSPRASYARLASRPVGILRRSDPMHEELGPAAPGPEGHEDQPHDAASHVPRPVAYQFDFLELSLGPFDLSEGNC